MIETQLQALNTAQDNYRTELDRVIPMLFQRALEQMKSKRVAIRLTDEVDVYGNYFDPSQRRNGSSVYYAFPQGIRRHETHYNKEGEPRSREVPVPQDEFLAWTRERFERAQDVYTRLLAYEKVRPLEANFPKDDIC